MTTQRDETGKTRASTSASPFSTSAPQAEAQIGLAAVRLGHALQ
jgi:hypothetical protein